MGIEIERQKQRAKDSDDRCFSFRDLYRISYV